MTAAMQTGIVYAIMAGLFWGTSPVLVKRGLVHSDVSAATLLQQSSILLTLILFALFEGSFVAGEIPVAALIVFVATGVVGAYLGRTLFVISVDQMGAARAQSVNNSAPVITVLLAALFLGESLTPFVLGGVLLIVSGILFITGPPPEGQGPNPTRTLTFASVLATLCYGVVPVMKKLGTDMGGPPVLGALIMHATGLLLLVFFGSLLKIELRWHRLPFASGFCFVCSGVLQAFGSILTLKALAVAPASVVAPIWNMQPIVSFFLARAMLKGIEVVTVKDGLAAALVVAGILVLRWG